MLDRLSGNADYQTSYTFRRRFLAAVVSLKVGIPLGLDIAKFPIPPSVRTYIVAWRQAYTSAFRRLTTTEPVGLVLTAYWFQALEERI